MHPTALITWASSGIGLEFARIFAREWYDLVLVARNMPKLETLAGELTGVKVTLIEQDLSHVGSAQVVYDTLIAKNIDIEILVNNAWFGDYGYFHMSDLSRQTEMIDLNIRTLTELTYLFGKKMIERKSGKILNVASTAAFQPGPLMSVYFATKHYVLAFSEALSEEWIGLGVTVTTLCPWPTESGFWKAASAEASGISSRHLPTSHDVAEYGYRSLMTGKRVAIHGWRNRFLVFIVRFMPKSLIVKIVRRLQEKRTL